MLPGKGARRARTAGKPGQMAGKVPVIMQMEALECGAACLAMIAAYYGKWVPLEQVRADCGVSRDGSKASNVVRAARAYGFEASGFRMQPEALRSQGVFPCIVHWNFSHFVVCRGFKGGKVHLNDPARGEVTVTEEEFDAAFTGVMLRFVPGPDFQPSGKPRSVWEFVGPRLQGSRAALAFVAITAAVTAVVGIINPALSQVFMDRLLGGKNPEWLYPFIALLIAVGAVRIVVEVLNAMYLLRLEGKMAVVSNSSFMWKVLHLPMEFFSQRMAGDLSARAATNTTIAASLVKQLAPLLLNFVLLVLYAVVMVAYSPLLAAIGIASVVINLGMARLISAKRVNVTRVQMRDAGKLAAATVSGIEMVETIKAAGAEGGYFERWAGFQAGFNTQQVRFARLGQRLGLVPQLVMQVTNTAVLMTGVYLVLQGQFTVGMILAFQGYLSQFMAPASTLTSVMQTLQEMRTDMERIEDVMRYPDDPAFSQAPLDRAASCEKLKGAVHMEGVTFGYSRLEEPLIKDFDLDVESGRSVAFVGPSGCGKSTLAKLVSGLFRPWSGAVSFDGSPMDEVPREVLIGSVAVVDQDIVLFNDTIANNIRLWDTSIEDYEVILAARDAGIHEVIMQRDGGYNAVLSEGGRDLSGGQRQRLEIARVLAQDPTVLIMDEATSALDAKTEQEVMSAVRKRGITCIVVAHRLSTVRDCDEIVVLDKGRVVERGTHEELCERGGMYLQLVTQE